MTCGCHREGPPCRPPAGGSHGCAGADRLACCLAGVEAHVVPVGRCSASRRSFTRSTSSQSPVRSAADASHQVAITRWGMTSVCPGVTGCVGYGEAASLDSSHLLWDVEERRPFAVRRAIRVRHRPSIDQGADGHRLTKPGGDPCPAWRRSGGRWWGREDPDERVAHASASATSPPRPRARTASRTTATRRR